MRECFVSILQPQIDAMYLSITNVLPAPAVFYLRLMGTCLPYSLIKLGIIQRTLWSWGVGSQSSHLDINSKYLTNLLQAFSLSLYSNSKIFFISTSQPDSNSTPFLFFFFSRFSTWPMTWPVRWCGSLTWLVWCCCCVTGTAAFSSWFQCCRTSLQTAGCPSTRWR